MGPVAMLRPTFTDMLIKYSSDTRYAYNKAKLNEQYLKP